MPARPGNVRSPEAYAVTVTTRLAIDALRSARHRREYYVGPWLPEPLVDCDGADPAWQIEMEESVSVAFLVVLETLSPIERAVFVLRELFGYEYAELATVVGRSEANCRQILHRARQHIDDRRARFEPSATERDRLAEQFFAAIRDGDLGGLESVLADDVVFYGDGGGKAPAVRKPVRGATQVARFLLGLARQANRLGCRLEPARVNGQPGVWISSHDGAVLGVLALGIGDGGVVTAYNQINPDKLAHLGTVGDLGTLQGTAY